MKRLLLALIVLPIGLASSAQECHPSHLRYTGTDYLYACVNGICPPTADASSFLRHLREEAVSLLASQFETRVQQQASLDKRAVNGHSATAYSSSTTFSTDITLKFVHTEVAYDSILHQGWAIAYLDQRQACEYYANEYTKAVSRVETALSAIAQRMAAGQKVQARDKELPLAKEHLRKTTDAVGWLAMIDCGQGQLGTMVSNCGRLEQIVRQREVELSQGVALYLHVSATLDGRPYPAFATELKGRLKKLGCHFVNRATEADWSVEVTASVCRTSSAGIAYFAWVDGDIRIVNTATGQTTFEDWLSAMSGQTGGIKGAGDTKSHAASAHDAFKKAASVSANGIIDIVSH